jgi:hypothetical protein
MLKDESCCWSVLLTALAEGGRWQFFTDYEQALRVGVSWELPLSNFGCKRSCPFVAFHFESLRRYRSSRRHICDVDSNCELPVF